MMGLQLWPGPCSRQVGRWAHIWGWGWQGRGLAESQGPTAHREMCSSAGKEAKPSKGQWQLWRSLGGDLPAAGPKGLWSQMEPQTFPAGAAGGRFWARSPLFPTIVHWALGSQGTPAKPTGPQAAASVTGGKGPWRPPWPGCIPVLPWRGPAKLSPFLSGPQGPAGTGAPKQNVSGDPACSDPVWACDLDILVHGEGQQGPQGPGTRKGEV